MNVRTETPTEIFKWRIYKLCVWMGPGLVVAWCISYLVAGWAPDIPGPQPSAEEVAQMFEDNRTAIRIGLIVIVATSSWLAPFYAITTVYMRRIEGAHSPLAYIQLGMAALLVFEFCMPMMMMQAAAYREDRPIWDILLIYDVSWMLFVGIVCTALMQYVVTGLCILQDDRPEPIFPRWSGWFNIFCGVTIGTPGSILVFFKDGPFAWDGIITWWLVVFAFFAQVMVMAYLLLKAIDRHRAEEAEQPILGTEDLTTEVAKLRAELARVALLAEGDAAAVSRSS